MSLFGRIFRRDESEPGEAQGSDKDGAEQPNEAGSTAATADKADGKVADASPRKSKENPSAASSAARPAPESPGVPASAQTPAGATPAASAPAVKGLPAAPANIADRAPPAQRAADKTQVISPPPAVAQTTSAQPQSTSGAAGMPKVQTKTTAAAPTHTASAELPKPAARVPAGEKTASPQSAKKAAAPVAKAPEPQAGAPEKVSSTAARPAEKVETPLPSPREGVAPDAVQPAICAPEPAQPTPRESFDESSARSLEPLRLLLLELKWAKVVPREWVKRSIAPLTALRGLADKLEDSTIGMAIDTMLASLKKVESAAKTELESELGRELVWAYAALGEKIPAAIDPAAELARRDLALLEALLPQVEGIQHTILEKLRQAGWCTSERFLGVTADELAQETGIGCEVAQRLIATVQRVRGECATLTADPTRPDELRRLSHLLDQLRSQHAQFEQACMRFDDQGLQQRRILRTARQHTLRRTYVFLARSGDLERITLLERAPYQGKIRELEDYVSSRARTSSAS